jgi:hypothetical protein
MQIFDVLGMQISPFESKKQDEYLNPKLTSFSNYNMCFDLINQEKN